MIKIKIHWPDKTKAQDQVKRTSSTFKKNQREKLEIAKHCMESGHYYTEINLLQDVRNSKVFILRNTTTNLINNEPEIL